MKVKRNNLGFSLLEILIAVSILAGSVGVFLTRAENSSRLVIEDRKELVAITLANNKMIETEREIQDDLARGKFVDELEEKGSFEDPFQDFSWVYAVRKIEIPVVETGEEGQSVVAMAVIKNVMKEISKAVREVKLTVYWGETNPETKEPEKSFSLITHVVNIK